METETIELTDQLRLENTINKINAIWTDVKNWDTAKLTESWSGENSALYKEKLLNVESNVKALTEKLNEIKLNLKKYDEYNENSYYSKMNGEE